MLKEYNLDAEDEKIIDELDNLFGVIQNKEVLKNMVIYSKLREDNEVKFGNYNIIIRNDSSYSLLKDFLNVCAKLFIKNNIIPNDKICFLKRKTNSGTLDMSIDTDASIIVINERKVYLDYEKEIESLKKLMKTFKNKIFVFEDTNYCEGQTDAVLGNLASWRMTIEKISLDDKIMYCRNMFDENQMKYKKQGLRDFADQPFWKVKNNVMQLIIENKANGNNYINSEMLKKKAEKVNKNIRRKRNIKIEKQNAKEELDELIGLTGIKEEISKILNYIKLNKERGKMPTLHMCFTGNPGTGKTSVARIIGKLFSEEKILSGNGEFVEIHGRDLVAKYVGWTAQNVHDIVEKAIGGVLFIDEAYSLISERKGGFEDEAIATLIKEMEDHREEVCIILAGYTEEMKELLKENPGFESRIQFTINFPDYTEEELYEIFTELCKKEKYRLSNNCKEILLENFRKAKEQECFGNGRYVRNIFEKIKFEQADRIVKANSKNINIITKQDIQNTLNLVRTNSRETRRVIGF